MKSVRVLLLDRGITGNPHVLGLASGLRDCGAEVRIGGPSGTGRSDIVPVFPRSDVQGHYAEKGAYVLRGAGEFMRLLRWFRPQVVHLQWPGTVDVVYARLARSAARAHIVFTVHEPRRSGVYGWRQTQLARLAKRCIVLGPHMLEEVARLGADVHQKTCVTSFGNYEHVVTRFPRQHARERLGLEPGKRPVYAFIGTIRRNKGIEGLLQAHEMQCGESQTSSGSVIIAGMAPEASYARLLQARASRSDAIRWLVSDRRLPHETLNLVASAADQIVLPFESGSFSASLVFAMTHGRCVVTTEVGENARTLHGQGILVRPADPKALKKALDRAVDDREGCERLGEAARRYALDELSWAKAGRETLGVYAQATNEPEW